LIDYHSHNTRRLTEEEMVELLLNLREIREDIEPFLPVRWNRISRAA